MTDVVETHQVMWQEIPVTITYKPNWLNISAHLELRAGERLPVTETGYRSVFLSAESVTEAGGPVAFAIGLLDEAAQSPAWKEYRQERRQLSLF